MIRILFILFSFFITLPLHASKGDPKAQVKQGPQIEISTAQGTVYVTLFQERNPEEVSFFLKTVQSGFYSKTLFHRIMDGFILQGGIYDASFHKKDIIKPEKLDPITEANKAKNSLLTFALIRDRKDHSVLTNQFFINLANNSMLDQGEERKDCDVIGEVTGGFDVIQKLSRLKIGQREGLYNVPFYPEEALIKSIQIVKN